MQNLSQASENNKHAILEILAGWLTLPALVLEIGSGSGQHAIYFAEHLPHLTWQPSDQGDYFPGLQHNIGHFAGDNVRPPQYLDLQDEWPVGQVDHIYCANVLHIISDSLLRPFFTGAGKHLGPGGYLLVYGPFRYKGAFTTESNAAFDVWLKNRDPASGIKDIETITLLAHQNQLDLTADVNMPANNQLLVFKKAP